MINTPPTKSPVRFMSRTTLPITPPEIVGQIGPAESEHIIKFFKEVYLPIFLMAEIDLKRCRILELGSGFGALAYGSLMSIAPREYVATDIYPELVEALDVNLARWGTGTSVSAAILNPEDDLIFEDGRFDVIQSHSVLHHVLDYNKAVDNLYRKLAPGGVLIFAEPSTDGYLYLVTIINTILFIKSVNPLFDFSEDFLNTISALKSNLIDRTGHHGDLTFLARYGHGDKHIFGLHDVLEMGRRLGSGVHVQAEHRGINPVVRFQLVARGASDRDKELVVKVLEAILPQNAGRVAFSDMRIVFGLIKPKKSS